MENSPDPHSNTTRRYLDMLISHHLNPPPPPPISVKDIQGYTPYLGYWLPLTNKKSIPFSPGFLGKSSSENIPETTAQNTPFPEKI